tara:strand:- start:430 stop:861 length:432 start_codon:yes stop_codon:yes gene_type:complete
MKGVRYERRCTKIMEDGYRCGKIFHSSTRVDIRLCEECTRGTNAGLVRSTNKYAKAGNDKKIRDFVINLMTTHENDKKIITDLIKGIESLGNRLVHLETNTEIAVNLKLEKDIEKLKRQNKVNEKKIESMRKLIHNMKKARDI